MNYDINPYVFRWVENHRAQIKTYHDQANHSYKRDEIALEAQYSAERERMRLEGKQEIEQLRQAGQTSLQEREHSHGRLLLELSQAEERLRADDAHAKQLALAKKNDELATFQKQREAVYALEAARFNTILAERQAHTTQILAEYASRNATGQSVVAATATMLTSGLQDNSKLNEMILAAVIAKKASQSAHRQKLEELDKKSELGLSDDINRFKKENGL